jgi:hypothetical protein
MEDVLELYAEPLKACQPVVCFDERPCVLHGDTRSTLPVQPGRAARYDYEYQRNETCNLFLMFQPRTGWRQAKVTDQRKKADFADYMRELVDVHFPHVRKSGSSWTTSTPIPLLRYMLLFRLPRPGAS